MWRVENTGRKKLLSGHHRTTLFSYIFANKACIDNQKKLVQQQDPNKFQQVSHLAFITAAMSFTGGQPNFADAKMILTAPLPENWRKPPGPPRITWLNTVQRDLRAYNLTLNKSVDLPQNRPL